MFKLSNISIGLKLSMMSGLGILFVVGLIVAQIWGSASVKSSGDLAELQIEINLSVPEALASFGGVQMGVKDMRTAFNEEQLQTAAKYAEEEHRAFHLLADPLPAKLLIPENKQRVEKIIGLAHQYWKDLSEALFCAIVESGVNSLEGFIPDKVLQLC
jgi:hypothetical protein